MTFSPLAQTNGHASTRGHVARQVAGAESVEIKATIDAHNVRKALKLLGLAPGKGELRLVYFFDTPKLELFRSGTIARARRVPGGEHDSTVKIRPVDPGQVPGKWPKDKGFKLEADAGESAVVRSASLSRPLPKGLVKDVTAGKDRVSKLFDEAQELFLAEMCRIRYDLDQLAVLGPISALWWKIAHKGLPFPMTAELWTRADKATMLEVSIRVPAAQAAFASAGFMAFLAELGAERENAQQAKTRWALEFYAGRIDGKGKPKPRAKAKVKAAKAAAADAVKKRKPAAKAKNAVAPKAGAAPARARNAKLAAAGNAKPRAAKIASSPKPKAVVPAPAAPAAETLPGAPEHAPRPLPRRSMHTRAATQPLPYPTATSDPDTSGGSPPTSTS